MPVVSKNASKYIGQDDFEMIIVSFFFFPLILILYFLVKSKDCAANLTVPKFQNNHSDLLGVR